MTLVDEERQFHLLDALNSHAHHVKLSCGGSACNSIVAIRYFGLDTFYSAKMADEEERFFVEDPQSTGVNAVQEWT